MKHIASKDERLKAELIGNRLVISIGISTLAFALSESSENQERNETTGEFERQYAVTDEQQFAKEVLLALNDENEAGDSLLTKLFDTAMLEAIEDGAIGVGEVRRPRGIQKG